MNRFLRGLTRAVAESFPLPGPVVEVGSYQVEGQEDLADVRSLFPGRDFLGIDLRDGPGVDKVDDVESLSLPDASVGTVVALSTFEHVRHFWRGFDEIYRVLRPDGALFISCPFYVHIHDHPSDYWRFTPEALKVLLEAYPSKLIGWHGPATRPLNVWALAFREEHPPITAEQCTLYSARMSAYAREPLSWKRRLLYSLGRVLCGRRPFAPYLDRDCWQCEVLERPRSLPPRKPEAFARTCL
jgi:SAM-dependent methyltransferase